MPFPTTAVLAAVYVLRNLESLGGDLAAIGIPLLVEEAPLFSDSPKALQKILERHCCKALYFNREYEFNEAARDERSLRRSGPGSSLSTDLPGPCD